MGRPVVLSNGQMFIGLDESGLVHDFYYPYVGLENLTTARSSQHKIGVWVNGVFSWTNDGTWDISIDFEEDALISNICLKNTNIAVTLKLQDFIDHESNSFIRHITIENNSEEKRGIRLFMHQVFEISRSGRADTALYVPDDNYILDYKGRYSLAISGKYQDGASFDQWAVGNYGIENKAGTYIDAEDGELSGNAVEHGGVDSVIRFKRDIEGLSCEVIDYWIIATSSQSDAQRMNDALKDSDIEQKLFRTREYWQKWVHEGDNKKTNIDNRSLDHSLLIVKAHIDERGSILASGDSSIFNYGRDYYCYCWPRDAVYALWPLIRLGHFEEAKAFFEFARDTMHKDGYLMHKYQPDRAIGSTWHPLVHGKSKELAIQEDETAGVVFLINEYYKASRDKKFINHIYHSFVSKAANFMCEFIDHQTGLPHASYDLWEEKFLTSTYTVSTVIAGLEAASEMARILDLADDSIKWSRSAEAMRDNLDLLFKDGIFVKGYLLGSDGQIDYDMTLDISSLYGPFMFAGLEKDDHRIISTLEQVERRILNKSPSGGVIRYEHDSYYLTKPYLGNPWIVTTLWLAQVYIALGKTEQAVNLYNWVRDRQLPSGVLSEQFDPEDKSPLGVTPLVWSHAEVINTLLDMNKK